MPLRRSSQASTDEGETLGHANQPWWKRPSPWWYLCLVPLTSIADNATMAPRIEILNILACERLKSEYHLQTSYTQIFGEDVFNMPGLHALTKSPPNNTQYVATPNSVYLDNSRIVVMTPNLDECKKDPDVQRAVAKVTTAMTITLGVLGVITVGWWGSVSDRIGRTRVVGINVLGALIMDFAFIAVALFSKLLPGGYWFVLIGPIFEGLVGGFGAAEATVIAYLSDTTKPGERARFFSLNLGVVFAGMAIGPALGSVLRRATGTPLSVFYFSAICHILFSLVNWTVVPESLSIQRREEARQQRTGNRPRSPGLKGMGAHGIRALLSFAEPLAVMLPVRRKGPRRGKKIGRYDWSLTLVGFSHMFSLMVLGADPYILQYAQATYSWSSEEIGYMLSVVGVARAIFLLTVLPFLLRLLKPKKAAIQLPEENEAEDGPKRPSLESVAADLWLARLSQIAGFITYPIMSLAPSGILFTVAGSAAALSTGVRPALQSVALTVYTSHGGKDAGRLFGALSVLQALGVSVFGPGLLGFAYLHTVGWLSQTLFFVAAGTTAIGFLLLQFVRLPEQYEDKNEDENVADEENDIRASLPREETLIDTGSFDGGAQAGKQRVVVQE